MKRIIWFTGAKILKDNVVKKRTVGIESQELSLVNVWDKGELPAKIQRNNRKIGEIHSVMYIKGKCL